MGSLANPHEALLAWAKEHGAALHPCTNIQQDPQTGTSFKVMNSAGAKVSAGDEVVTCPMSITLSYLNTLLRPPQGFRKDANSPFPPNFLARTPPHVIGRFLLMKEYLAGKQSFWHPYIQMLPQPENLRAWGLPPFWPEEDVELLEGTNLEISIQEIKDRLRKEFKAARKLLEGWAGWRDYSRILYNWSFCIFTSRSFLPEQVVPDHEAVELPDGCSWRDFSLLLPLLDLGNHSLTAKVSWETDCENPACRLVTKDVYAPGEQIFNNYGMKTNSQLLLGYGFVIPETDNLHNDYIHIRKRADLTGDQDSKTEEFLLSLRPMTHPSSVLGRAFQPLSLELLSASSEIAPPFTHVQEEMVLDLIRTTTPAWILKSVGLDDRELVRQFLTGRVEAAGLRPMMEPIVAIIQHKALQELERLDETETSVAEEGEGEEVELDGNRRLAIYYRGQCRKVLNSVLESIEGFGGDS